MTAAALRNQLAVFAALSILATLSPTGRVGAGTAPVLVAVGPLATKRIHDTVELDGSVSPFQQVNLVARVAGTLEEIKFKDGDLVHKDQVLFVIEQPPYIEQLKLNQARLDQSKADYNRQVDLVQQKAISQSSVETSLSNLKQAEANVAIAQINLDYTTVKSPFDGIIGKRQVDAGNYVGATVGGTVLATVMQISPAYVYASIGERDALSLRTKMAARGLNGQSGVGRAVVHALLQGESLPGETGVLDFIDHQVNQTTGTISLRGRFDNKDLHLVPGFYAKLVIEVGSDRDALVLPRAVILNDQEGDHVFVLGADKLAHRRNLTTAALPNEETEVLTGLNGGDPVIVAGGNKLSDGQPVQVLEPSRTH